MTGRGRYELVGRGSDLAIEVAGPDAASCLQAAVRGFAAALVELPVDVPTRRRALRVDETSAADLLVALIDECVVRLDADGELAVDLGVDSVDGGRLVGHLVTCDLADVRVHGVAPKAATWHDVRLGPAGDGWAGRVMIDL